MMALDAGYLARYDLSPVRNGNVVGVAIRIHEAICPHLHDLFARSGSRAMWTASRFRVPGLCIDMEHSWGFGPVFHATTSPFPGWMEWLCPFPRFNSGEESRTVLQHLRAVSLTWDLLLDMLDLFEQTGLPGQQLMRLQMSFLDYGVARSPMEVTLAPVACDWLARHPGDLPEVTQGMREAYEWIHKDSIRFRERFPADADSRGSLYLQVPGEASTLSARRPGPDEEMILEAHNIDRPDQQLTFLMGLAVLHARWRSDGL